MWTDNSGRIKTGGYIQSAVAVRHRSRPTAFCARLRMRDDERKSHPLHQVIFWAISLFSFWLTHFTMTTSFRLPSKQVFIFIWWFIIWLLTLNEKIWLYFRACDRFFPFRACCVKTTALFFGNFQWATSADWAIVYSSQMRVPNRFYLHRAGEKWGKFDARMIDRNGNVVHVREPKRENALNYYDGRMKNHVHFLLTFWRRGRRWPNSSLKQTVSWIEEMWTSVLERQASKVSVCMFSSRRKTYKTITTTRVSWAAGCRAKRWCSFTTPQRKKRAAVCPTVDVSDFLGLSDDSEEQRQKKEKQNKNAECSSSFPSIRYHLERIPSTHHPFSRKPNTFS